MIIRINVISCSWKSFDTMPKRTFSASYYFCCEKRAQLLFAIFLFVAFVVSCRTLFASKINFKLHAWLAMELNDQDSTRKAEGEREKRRDGETMAIVYMHVRWWYCSTMRLTTPLPYNRLHMNRFNWLAHYSFVAIVVSAFCYQLGQCFTMIIQI